MAIRSIGIAFVLMLGVCGLSADLTPAQAAATRIQNVATDSNALRAKRHRHRAAPSASIIAAVKAHARAAGVPVALALAVVRHESSFNPRARGRAGEIGLMQLKCQTARGMGYRGACGGLYNVATNLRYGMRYLKLALRRGGVAYYNAGIGAKRLPKAAKRYALQVRRKIRKG